MARAGRTLEKLVALLERVLGSAYEGTKVQSPAYLTNSIAGNKREIDVLVSVPMSHGDLHLAFEVRDRKPKVGSGDIEAFITKTKNLPIHDKFFVSRSGFTKPALKIASSEDITCLSLDDAESFPWSSLECIFLVNRKCTHTRYRALPTDLNAFEVERLQLGYPKDSKDIELTDYSGILIPWDNVGRTAWAEITQRDNDPKQFPPPGGIERQTIVHFSGIGNERMRWKDSSVLHKISELAAIVTFSIEVKMVPVKNMKYHDLDNASDIAELVHSESFPLSDNISASVVMVKGPEQTTQMYILPTELKPTE